MTIIETQPHYKHHFRERRAMLDTALRMIANGKFQNSAIREIAFHARLAESTALHFFPNNALLLQELELQIVEEVSRVIKTAMSSSRIKKTRFLNTWLALYQFYLRNAGYYKFIEQSSIMPIERGQTKTLQESLNVQLIEFFQTVKNTFTATQSAAIFQMSVVSTVKLNSEQHLDLIGENLEALALNLWRTLTRQ